ncbi:MAG: TonB-dependent receptor [Pseudohongiellaceae bacterium]
MKSRQSQFKRRSSFALAAAIASLGASSLVHAQVPPDSPEGSIEEITITGSRISRDGYDSPNPISVLGQEDLNAEAPANVAEFAMTLPSIQGSTTSSTSSGSLSSGNAGIASLNLRGMGTGRTLVLFDGQRNVVSSAAGLVDTNTFPQSLIERVEVSSGGASAAYGSDAIAGVVNFILDRDFEGLDIAVETGEASEYDARDERVEVTAGFPFADGQGHMLLSGEYFHRDGVHNTAPEWAQDGYWGIPNPAYEPGNGQPFYLVSEGIGISSYTPGGLITNGPLRGTHFTEGGAVEQLDFGPIGGQWMVGGDYEYSTSAALGTNSLQGEDDRNSLFGRMSWEFAPNLEVYAQASWASYEGYSFYIRPTDRNRTIQIDNAFLPQQVVDAMNAEGITSFNFSTNNADFPASGTNNYRETTRFVFGADGYFDAMGYNVDWDAYVQIGETNTDEHQNPTFAFDALADATDAVVDPATGDIVCRSTLSDPGNGCVPLNRFGVGVASEAGLDYVLGRPRREQEITQDVFGVNFVVNDIEAWAGPISLAFGGEYREEAIDGFVDPKFISGWKYGNYQVTTGALDVAEVYVETVVPVFAGFEFNGAARATDYSTSGRVNTWKAGFTYQPIDDITLRVTQSNDIRAPNMSELFDAGRARTNAVAIDGQSVDFIQNLTGTPTVGPEEADTLGVGVVFQPTFLPGFSASVDYYEVDISGVIGFIPAQEIADACLVFGVQSRCNQLRRDENGDLEFIDLQFENLDFYLAEGYDIEASYRADIGPGTMSLRFMTTHYIENTTDDGVTQRNRAGENTSSTPDWVYRGTARYDWDEWTVNLTARGVSDGVIDNRFIECGLSGCPASVGLNRTINDNSVDGEWFYDLYGSYDLSFGGGEGEVFISIKNLFDTDPALYALPLFQGSENRPAYLPTNRSLNDVMGRNFRIGFRYNL